MTPTSPLDRAFSALADPTRRAILARLAEGPRNVGDLARPFAMSLPAVSRHLSVLEEAGLIRRERRAQERVCSLAPGGIEDAARWVERMRAFWEARFDALERHLNETKGKGGRHGRRRR